MVAKHDSRTIYCAMATNSLKSLAANEKRKGVNVRRKRDYEVELGPHTAHFLFVGSQSLRSNSRGKVRRVTRP